MSFTATYDPTTDLGAVRMLLLDVDLTVVPTSPSAPPRKTWTVVFADQEITATINRYAPLYPSPAYVYYAAAELLDAMANNKAFLEKRLKIGDYERDTKTTAKSLGDRANAMRHFADNIPAEAITDVAWTDANYSRILYNMFIASQ